MLKKVLSILIIIILIVGYARFLYLYENKDTNTAPIIEIENSHMEISVNDSPDKLLEGVRAYDREDGELTEEIIVESLSVFDNEQKRTVKYVVFDKNSKAAEATRTISYTDYSAPKIRLLDSLIQGSIQVSKINKMVGGISSVDGDISNNVKVDIGTLQENELVLKLNLKDSTGKEENLSVVYEYDKKEYTAKIVLEEYLMYLPVGQMCDLRSNIKEIQQGKSLVTELKELVTIESDVDFNHPGVYEVYYSISDTAGIDARTKGIIVIR